MDINLTQLQNLIHIAENAAIDELEISDGMQNIRIVCRVATHQATPTTPAMPMTHANQSTASNAITNPPVPSSTAHQSIPESAAESNVAPKNESTAPPTSQASSQATINAPMLGTFYLRANPDAAPFVSENATVAVNQTLCIIEAMKIMHEVKAEKAGKITQILATEGDMVEYSQPLFVIE